MANDDSTRPGFDLSPWLGQDSLSIFQAAWLWAGIPPTLPTTPENETRYRVELAAARGWYAKLKELAEAGELTYEKPVPTRQGACTSRAVTYMDGRYKPAKYQQVEDWPAARVALADLLAYAESIGQRPAFFFPDAEGAETKKNALEQRSTPGSKTNNPPKEWARGMRRVAWDAAKAIIEGGDNLTAEGLEKAMLDSEKVELAGDEYRLKPPHGDLYERELKATPKTIAGWVTALKNI